MVKYPSIYEINTRVWLNGFNTPEKNARLCDVPSEYWKNLAWYGIEYVWLMGIWKTCETTIEKYCFEDELKNSYSKALKDWKRDDVIGSPYSIDVYEVNPKIGTEEDLKKIREDLTKAGIKLILDFIPNHFSADTSLLHSNPEIFLQVDEAIYVLEKHTFYQPDISEKKYYAHGRDPFFSAWQDTIQVNYCSEAAREYHKEVLSRLTSLCDGVRCDMAMLALNNVFKNTWAGVLPKECNNQGLPEYWKELISTSKTKREDFLFIAEAYWDLEWPLQQLGFDYTYDKRLTDRLKHSVARETYDHLLADIGFQEKSLRFLENHDEQRAITEFGKEKSKAAAIIISTIPGARFYNDGQFEGKKIKLPVQLGREPEEVISDEIKSFYCRLLRITSEKIFKNGEWKLLHPICSWEKNNSYNNILAWHWKLGNEKRIVVVNYANTVSTCRIKIDIAGYEEEFVIVDLLNEVCYTRSAEEVYNLGLYIELKPYNAHIFDL